MLYFTEAYKCVYTNMNNSLKLMLLEGRRGGLASDLELISLKVIVSCISEPRLYVFMRYKRM